MFLQNDHLIVTLGSATFYSHQQPWTTPTFYFDETALVGWLDGVGPKRNTTTRPVSDGDFAEPANLNSRLITMTGAAKADTVANLHAMRDEFMGLVSDGLYHDFSVTDTSGTRWASVGLGGQPAWVQQSDKTATWKIDLYAPDPRVYGVQKTQTLMGLQVNGGLKTPIAYPLDYGVPKNQQGLFITNSGNANAWPGFRVTGNYPSGFSLTDNLGNFITYTGAVGLTAPVYIDSLEGTATQGGQDRSTFLSKRNWWPIGPGVTLTPSFLPLQAANGWCDIIYRDTWI